VKILQELSLRSRSMVFVLALVSVAAIGWIFSRYAHSPGSGSGSGDRADAAAHVAVVKEPVSVVTRTFDPANPPSEMPPLSPGEIAVCDANYVSNVSVGGEGRQTDATHEIVSVTQVKANLRLVVTIWLPEGASQHVAEHEDGHRQIAEALYANADKLVTQIAAAYIGKKDLISGGDLNGQFTQLLQQEGAAITDEFNKQLNPEPVQLSYDAITDHSRNDVAASDAVAQVLKDAAQASATPATPGGN
jgi:hypothetical protein